MGIKINNREIDMSKDVYFIADIAANHEGELSKAKELLHACAESRVDAVKMQNFTAETIVSQKGFDDIEGLSTHQSNWSSSVFDSYKAASIPLEWSFELSELSRQLGMDYFTTPYSPALVEAVSPYVCAFKIGSGDITWLDNLIAIAKQNRPILLATGASTMDDVDRAMKTLLKYNSDILLMQCNTDYTAAINDTDEIKSRRFGCINLAVLKTFQKHWPHIPIGLSDHTHGHDTVLAATALFNCSAVEKHFTLDNSREGQDHSFSMTPNAWKKMVEETCKLKSECDNLNGSEDLMKAIRNAMSNPQYLELMIGDGVKKVETNEKNTIQVQRRSVRAKCDIPADVEISEAMLEYLRPCPTGALEPYRKHEVIGKRAKSAINEGDLVLVENVQ